MDLGFSATEPEIKRRDEVVSSTVEQVRLDKIIPMNAPEFAGEIAEFTYFFEGEDDLLHLTIARKDQEQLSVREAQEVVRFLLPNIPPGLIWVKPGTKEHHFYLGHDELLNHRE